MCLPSPGLCPGFGLGWVRVRSKGGMSGYVPITSNVLLAVSRRTGVGSIRMLTFCHNPTAIIIGCDLVELASFSPSERLLTFRSSIFPFLFPSIHPFTHSFAGPFVSIQVFIHYFAHLLVRSFDRSSIHQLVSSWPKVLPELPLEFPQ